MDSPPNKTKSPTSADILSGRMEEVSEFLIVSVYNCGNTIFISKHSMSLVLTHQNYINVERKKNPVLLM